MKTDELSPLFALHQDAMRSLCEQFANHIEGNFVSPKIVKAFCEAIADEVREIERLNEAGKKNGREEL